MASEAMKVTFSLTRDIDMIVEIITSVSKANYDLCLFSVSHQIQSRSSASAG